ncbi:MAG: threonine/serine dehydratase [Desulfofustis sp.]|nr:threonine/serine dehydratase [Desulfofustis sp.]NNK57510.1 threonine/serine dehydratase [Desulfofustis sp.]
MTTFTTALIHEAKRRIKPTVLRTPLIHSPPLSRLCGCQVYLKMECWQKCGCFKIRGVTNFLLHHQNEALQSGVATASSGNHALALAYGARMMRLEHVHIFLPEGADPAKISQIRQYGVEPVVEGKNFYETFDIARSYSAKNGTCYAHSNADPQVIAGQGTIGLEIADDLPDVDAVIVPVGGGGLISGIAAALKDVQNSTAIIGAEPEASPGAYQSLQEGKPCERIALKPSVADGLSGGFSPLPFKIAYPLIREIALASEDEIVAAMTAFFHQEQLVVEGGAAVGLAVLLARKADLQNKKVVLVVTGRNIDSKRFLSIIGQNGAKL